MVFDHSHLSSKRFLSFIFCAQALVWFLTTLTFFLTFFVIHFFVLKLWYLSGCIPFFQLIGSEGNINSYKVKTNKCQMSFNKS